MSFDVSLTGGYGRAVLRHLQRRGDTTADELFDHFVCGSHGWYPEQLTAAVAELIEHGFVFAPGPDGLVALVVRSPL